MNITLAPTILILILGFSVPPGRVVSGTPLTPLKPLIPLIQELPQTTATPLEHLSEVPTQPAPTPQLPPAPSGDAKSFIYNHESGNNPNATNSQGCYGLGQDCNGIVRDRCGADYACQDEYFTSYANSRYGGWENAAQVWSQKHWW